ncbi:hypothetical protein Hanom_Chr08g00743761 [Helianthus anomalus]
MVVFPRNCLLCFHLKISNYANYDIQNIHNTFFCSFQWRSLKISTRGSEVTRPKNIYLIFFYKIGGRKRISLINSRVNFRFAPCGLVTLTILLQTFKNSHFTP